MTSLGVKPKLRLGRKLDKKRDGKGGIEPLGPIKVKFLAEPEGITGKNYEGKPTKFLRFLVSRDGNEYHWFVPVLNKEGQPNYLLERIADIQIGNEYILEMKAEGGRNHIEVLNGDGTAITPRDSQGPAEIEEDDDETPPWHKGDDKVEEDAQDSETDEQ